MISITLNSGLRSALTGLQSVTDQQNETQRRLGSGLKVASPVDGPDAYFTSISLNSRAADLAGRLDGIAKGVKTLRAASAGVATIRELLTQARGLAEYARALSTTADAERIAVARDFNSLIEQVDLAAKDSGYDGVNLLHDDSLLVEFAGKAGSSNSLLSGFDARSGGTVVTVVSQTAADWTSDNTAIESAIDSIKESITHLQIQSIGLEVNLGVLTTRRVATEELIGILKEGAAELTNADTEVETAAFLSNANRQSFALRALQLSSESTQQVLRLFA